jgi:acyl carrier protein
MKKELPVILSLAALALAACERKEEIPAEKRPVEFPPTTEAIPRTKANDGPIHSTDVPTVGELAAADPRTAKVMTKVGKIISEHLGVTEDKVVPDADLSKDLGADNLKTMSLIMALEEEFNLSIKDEDAAKIRTVGDAVKTVISLGAR